MDGRRRQAFDRQHVVVLRSVPTADAEDERSGRTGVAGDPVEMVQCSVAADRSHTVVIFQVFSDRTACGDGRVIGEYAQLYTSHVG